MTLKRVIIDTQLNMSSPCDVESKRVNAIFGYISRAIISSSGDVILPLNTTLVSLWNTESISGVHTSKSRKCSDKSYKNDLYSDKPALQ